jgi:hypothetical protein
MSDFDGQKRIKYGEDSALPARFLTGLIFKHETRAILCHLFSPISLAFQGVTRKIWWWVSLRRSVLIYSDFLLNNMDEN